MPSEIIRKCGKRIEIAQGVIPHVLRHSFAMEMKGDGCDLFHRSDILERSNIEARSIYLNMNNQAMRDAFEKGVPRI